MLLDTLPFGSSLSQPVEITDAHIRLSAQLTNARSGRAW
jgi:hypothetical protein